MYAELSDFFYVWLKRSVGHLYPDFFRDTLTIKDDEAVAHPARFADLGRKKKDLARKRMNIDNGARKGHVRFLRTRGGGRPDRRTPKS